MAHSTASRRVAVDRLTVADAANLYLHQMYERADANQVTWGHFRSCQHRLKRIVERAGREILLANLGKGDLQALVLWFATRPPCKPRKYQKQPLGQPMSVVTAKGCITMVKALFVWLADHDDLQWERPRGFDRLFKLKAHRMKTPDEHARDARAIVSGDVKTFTVAELARIFRAATSRERLYILLGLNCGFTSGEISSLRTFEVVLDGNDPYIHKRRAKTGVEAKWALWPETAALLRRHRAPASERLSWLQTGAGNALVEVDAEGRRDAVDRAWTALWPRTGMTRWLSHRFLRKTGADAIKRLGGLEESEMFLAHQEGGMNKHYANRNWGKLWACLDGYRAELPFLGSAWDIDPEECLFTQEGNPDWCEANPPWVQHVTSRSRTGLLNVSLHPIKKKYYARVYQKGRTYSSRYFRDIAQAEQAGREIRRQLELGIDPRTKGPQ